MKDHETLTTHNVKDGLTVHLVIKAPRTPTNQTQESVPSQRPQGTQYFVLLFITIFITYAIKWFFYKFVPPFFFSFFIFFQIIQSILRLVGRAIKMPILLTT